MTGFFQIASTNNCGEIAGLCRPFDQEITPLGSQKVIARD
jgi:hypothetical protein